MVTQPKRRRRSRLDQSRLDQLSDAQLYALLAHVRTVLLDRPNLDMDLSVYLLRADEARLVALYQALPPALQEDGLARVEQALSMPADGRAPHLPAEKVRVALTGVPVPDA